MKIARFVLKVVGICLAVGAAACCIIAYWDKITDGVRAITEKLGCKRYCRSEYDDYADWDD